jgi:hypothetical protein
MDRPEYEQISKILRGLLIRLHGRIAPKHVTLIAEFIDAGELGLALDQLADVRGENERPISPSERADMLALAERVNMGERVLRVLQRCPDQRA